MSFFFDVFFRDGFVVASDVMLMESSDGIDDEKHLRKVRINPHSSHEGVNCAIVVCGDYPEVPLSFFGLACAGGDSLRDIAKRFAQMWTRRFAPESNEHVYSAVHLVGFETNPNGGLMVPQMWYWATWEPQPGYYTRETLEEHLQSFADSNPHNNHLNRIIANKTEVPTALTLEEEYRVAEDFLERIGAYITWNGDRDLWASANHAVNALQPIFTISQPDTLEELAKLTGICLDFLVRISSFLPITTLGFSPSEEVDIVYLSRSGATWFQRPSLRGTYN